MSNLNEWHIGRSHPLCSGCENAFENGDSIESAIFENEEYEIYRKDYHIDCWKSSEVKNTPHWKSQFHHVIKPKVNLADPDLLFNLFNRLNLSDSTENQIFAYLLSLHLMRKRVLVFDNVKRDVDANRETMILRPGFKRYGEELVEVLTPNLTEEETEVYDERLKKLLSTGELILTDS